MSNICLSEGVPRETIEKYAEDMKEEDNMTSKLKFVNRLAVELAKARGYESKTIKSWSRKN